jgi:hypothetical protein
MSDLCLSREEVRQLTRSPQRVKQVAFLRTNGIRHYVDAHGWPVVLRSAVEGGEKPKAPAAWTPRKAVNG